MYSTILNRQFKERPEHLVLGQSLRISIVDTTDKGRMLEISIADWGGFFTSFYTDTRYLAVHRTICGKDLNKIAIELRAYYGEEVDLTSKYNKGVFGTYGVFDVAKIWKELGYTPTKNMNLSQFADYLNIIEENICKE